MKESTSNDCVKFVGLLYGCENYEINHEDIPTHEYIMPSRNLSKQEIDVILNKHIEWLRDAVHNYSAN